MRLIKVPHPCIALPKREILGQLITKRRTKQQLIDIGDIVAWFCTSDFVIAKEVIWSDKLQEPKCRVGVESMQGFNSNACLTPLFE